MPTMGALATATDVVSELMHSTYKIQAYRALNKD